MNKNILIIGIMIILMIGVASAITDNTGISYTEVYSCDFPGCYETAFDGGVISVIENSYLYNVTFYTDTSATNCILADYATTADRTELIPEALIIVDKIGDTCDFEGYILDNTKTYTNTMDTKIQ
jgi:hypothetical protein